MGYRSEGLLLFDFNNPNVKRLVSAGLNKYLVRFDDVEEEDSGLTKTQPASFADEGENLVYSGFRFTGWKWYENYDEIKYLINAMNWLDKALEGMTDPYYYFSGYMFIRFGEEAEDVERRGDIWMLDMMDIDGQLDF